MRAVDLDDADHAGVAPRVPGIDDPVHFIVVAEEAVGLVDQEC